MKRSGLFYKIMAVLGVFQLLFLLGKLSVNGFSYEWSWALILTPFFLAILNFIIYIILYVVVIFISTKDTFK